MTEVWKAIDGYEGLYEVSNTGLVRSLNFNNTSRAKLLKPRKRQDGYLSVNLCKNGKHKSIMIHRLVASAFIQNPLNLETVNHKDENRANNTVSNLEWLSRKDNINYGTHNKRVAEANVNNPKRSKQVQMFDKSTGDLLTTFPSTKEAERRTSIAQENICHACKGRYKSAGGFVWRYV